MLLKRTSVILLLSFFFLSAVTTTKATLNLLIDNWDSGSTDQWNLWGSPLPVLNASANAQGTYSIDPNGDGSYHSGLVSKTMFDLSENIRFTIDTYIESAASWSELEFGLVNTNNIPTNPNTFPILWRR